MRLLALLAASLALCSALPASAGEVAGTVYDAQGRAVAGVTLALDGREAVSDVAGAYAFHDVAAGPQTVTAGTQAVAVVVPAEGAVRRNLFLISASARNRVTGVQASPADTAALLAETRRLAEHLLAEGSEAPARRVADSTG